VGIAEQGQVPLHHAGWNGSGSDPEENLGSGGGFHPLCLSAGILGLTTENNNLWLDEATAIMASS
jgi:hypothetical protein